MENERVEFDVPQMTAEPEPSQHDILVHLPRFFATQCTEVWHLLSQSLSVSDCLFACNMRDPRLNGSMNRNMLCTM